MRGIETVASEAQCANCPVHRPSYKVADQTCRRPYSHALRQRDHSYATDSGRGIVSSGSAPLSPPEYGEDEFTTAEASAIEKSDFGSVFLKYTVEAMMADPSLKDGHIILDGLVQMAYQIPAGPDQYIIAPDGEFALEVWDSDQEWKDKASQFETVGRDSLVPIAYFVKDALYDKALASSHLDPTGDGHINYVVFSDTQRAVLQHVLNSKVAVDIGGITWHINELSQRNIYASDGITVLRPGLIENMKTIMDAILAVEGCFPLKLDHGITPFPLMQLYLTEVRKIQLAWGYYPGDSSGNGAGWFKGDAASTQQFWYNYRVRDNFRAFALDVHKIPSDFNVFTATEASMLPYYYIQPGNSQPVQVDNKFYDFRQLFFWRKP